VTKARIEFQRKSAYCRITTEELLKVSELMNSIFLEMIGADPEQGAIIRRAEISQDFDITAYGPNDRTLNPDRDLNGASRRALTLAFILALTKVSEVEAPNVIDTPLGMTSGYVKRSILRTAVRESAQLILFLTHDEIAGCEEIIDQAAGKVFTLTNPAHFPKMLMNDLGVEERKVLRCECDHRNECQLCHRHPDVQVELKMASWESTMADRYFNPFQAIDINVPVEFHEAFTRYCQRSAGAIIDQSPFPRMVDLWFLSVCVAARVGLDPADITKHDTRKIIDGSILGSDPWRVHTLMLIAVGKTGDVQIVSEPRKMMTLANGLAVAGIPKVIEMLQNGSAEPIWNLSDAIDNLLR